MNHLRYAAFAVVLMGGMSLAVAGDPSVNKAAGDQPEVTGTSAQAMDASKQKQTTDAAETTGKAAFKPKEGWAGLTVEQESMIYESAAELQAQSVPQNMPMTAGAKIPTSIQLHDLSGNVRQQISGLQDYKIAKIESDQKEMIVLVDPTIYTVVDIITKK